MGIYKKEEGMWARMPTAIVGGIVTVYLTDVAMKWGKAPASYIWAGVMFAVLSTVTLYFVFFHRKTGEVLIDTESEMRKVVWPGRQEVTGSAAVVITTTIILGVTIYVMDIVLANFLKLIGLYRATGG